MSEKVYPVEEVVWLDAQSGFASAFDVSEFENWELSYTHSAGYLVFENDEFLVLAFMLFGSGVKHWQIIPKGMIKNRLIYSYKKMMGK